jgi:hypothetical protein
MKLGQDGRPKMPSGLGGASQGGRSFGFGKDLNSGQNIYNRPSMYASQPYQSQSAWDAGQSNWSNHPEFIQRKDNKRWQIAGSGLPYGSGRTQR